MIQLTQEEWAQVAGRIGDAAQDLEEVLEEYKEEEEEHEELLEYQKLAHDMRLAVGAILWVSENAAERVRFEMLDGHPPDGQ